VTAVRRTLEHELATNPRMLVFGEDVGRKGGVHAATLGLQEKFGADRVFDTSLSEEGIIGRAGRHGGGRTHAPYLKSIPQVCRSCRAEQLNDCGTIALADRESIRGSDGGAHPGRFFKCGDPWHSSPTRCSGCMALAGGWLCRRMHRNAVGLLRSALRGNDPTIFFEHRSLLDGAWARRPYPGDDLSCRSAKPVCCVRARC